MGGRVPMGKEEGIYSGLKWPEAEAKCGKRKVSG